jgi:transposase
MAHGNRGRWPPNATCAEVRHRVLVLARTRYQGLNHTHLTEMLAEREGVTLSRSTVREILKGAGLMSPRHRRPPRHRFRRTRMSHEGMLLQIDGSYHDWLEGRGPWFTLLLAVDDATGTVPCAIFREQEDTDGYLVLLEGIIRTRGIPMAIYCDRHSVFKHTRPVFQTTDRARQTGPTQFSRAMKELGISVILARSPQAKGRVEKAAGTFQDRLVSELRLTGVSSIGDANRVLADFLPRFNRRFGVPPLQKDPAYRQVDPQLDLATVLCCRHSRRVARDNTVRYQWRTLQLLPDSSSRSYAGYRVEIRQYPDGGLEVNYQGKVINTREVPSRPGYFRPSGMNPASGLEPMPPWLETILAEQAIRNSASVISRLRAPRRPTPRQQARWDAVQEAKQRGMTERAIATMLGISRNTVRKYASAISPPINRFESLTKVTGIPLEKELV